MVTELRVGAIGWNHPGWTPAYYPAELPGDWRLAYYANDFRAAMIPFDELLVSSESAVRQWRSEVPDDFLFGVEVKPHPAVASVLPRCHLLGDRLEGVLLRAPASELPRLAMVLVEILPDIPMSYDARFASRLQEHQMTSVPLACLWRGQPGATPAAPLAMGMLRASPDLRTLRNDVDAFLHYARHCTSGVLWAEGEPPDLTLLRHARLIGELLGH